MAAVFAENVRYYREIQGKSMREVADNIGVPYQTYVCWERKGTKPRKASQVDALARELQVEKSLLYAERNSTEPAPGERQLQEITEIYGRLNDTGKERLEQYARELAQIAGYLY